MYCRITARELEDSRVAVRLHFKKNYYVSDKIGMLIYNKILSAVQKTTQDNVKIQRLLLENFINELLFKAETSGELFLHEQEKNKILLPAGDFASFEKEKLFGEEILLT